MGGIAPKEAARRMAHRWVESIGCGCARMWLRRPGDAAPGSVGIAADILQRSTVAAG
jgi:hypothetical protein